MSGKVAFISENTIYFYSSLYFCRCLEAMCHEPGSYSLISEIFFFSATYASDVQHDIFIWVFAYTIKNICKKKKQGNLNSFKNIYYTPYLILYKQNFNIYLAQHIYVYMLSIDAYIDQTLLRYEFYLNK